MYILTEKEIEDILVFHPELIEENLVLLERQGQLESRRTDLMFKDQYGNLLLIELKKDVVSIEHVEQILDYRNRLEKHLPMKVRAMLVGQTVPVNIRKICNQKNIEWKEIKIESIFNYLKKNDPDLYHAVFYEGKLDHLKKRIAKKMSFQDYLNVTSPFGGPYTSYQFFKPIDASPELSDDRQKNQEVADAFIQLILHHPFHRSLFNNHIQIKKVSGYKPKWEILTKDKSWQGYVIPYRLFCSDFPTGLPCELYLGTIGYRGNKPIFADEMSRFIQVKVGRGKNNMTTQYGFHKYLRTEKRALLPFYEVKFSPRGLPKIFWNEIYETLNSYGYKIRDAGDRKAKKLLWIGDLKLDDDRVEEKVGDLIEALFAITIVKAHFKGKEKGIEFSFLKLKQ